MWTKVFSLKIRKKNKTQNKSRVGFTVLNCAIVKMPSCIRILKGRESPGFNTNIMHDTVGLWFFVSQ